MEKGRRKNGRFDFGNDFHPCKKLTEEERARRKAEHEAEMDKREGIRYKQRRAKKRKFGRFDHNYNRHVMMIVSERFSQFVWLVAFYENGGVDGNVMDTKSAVFMAVMSLIIIADGDILDLYIPRIIRISNGAYRQLLLYREFMDGKRKFTLEFDRFGFPIYEGVGKEEIEKMPYVFEDREYYLYCFPKMHFPK